MIDKKIKHLEFIQQVISRMASNSFLLKGWSVTLLVAFYAVIEKTSVIQYAWVTFIPIIFFWILDGYFLRQERLFRKHYDFVRSKDSGRETDFGMSTIKYQDQVSCLCKIMFSQTLLFFYVGLSLPTVIILFVYRYS